MPASPSSAIDYEHPDWSNAAFEAHCPLCNYNLRGLADPRCPECGYQFAWRDLLDPARKGHPYLFELCRGSRFAAFWKTAFHGLRPRKFWKTLRADQPIVAWRLTIYAIVVLSFCFIAIASVYATRNLTTFLDIREIKRITATFSSIAFKSYQYYMPAYGRFDSSIFQAIIAFGWPVLTFLSLMIFQISMRRAKVNSLHVLRCVVYASDVLIWLAMATLLLHAVFAIGILYERNTAPAGRRPIRLSPWDMELGWAVLFWACAGAMLIFQYRLAVAYWHYLRFRQVIATIFASQFIVLLAMFALIYYAVNWFGLQP